MYADIAAQSRHEMGLLFVFAHIILPRILLCAEWYVRSAVDLYSTGVIACSNVTVFHENA